MHGVRTSEGQRVLEKLKLGFYNTGGDQVSYYDKYTPGICYTISYSISYENITAVKITSYVKSIFEGNDREYHSPTVEEVDTSSPRKKLDFLFKCRYNFNDSDLLSL